MSAMNLTVNGTPVAVPANCTVLAACRAAGVEVPTLGHDARLQPAGVCRLRLAVWLALAGRTVTDKILAMVFAISAFVAAGFEHSVANIFFIPLGLFLSDGAGGGAGLVGMVHRVIYRRDVSGGGPPAGHG